MRPDIWTSDDIFSIPQFDLDRNNLFYYTIGQFRRMERKSIEPMALNVEGAKVQANTVFHQ